MNSAMREGLAAVLGGEVTDDGVGVTRTDGRYALINCDAGAVYFDRHACHVGYLTLGDDPRGCVEAEEWGPWDGSREWARGLATVLGGRAWRPWGCDWLVLLDHADGRVTCIGEESGAIYKDNHAFTVGAAEAEHREWGQP